MPVTKVAPDLADNPANQTWGSEQQMPVVTMACILPVWPLGGKRKAGLLGNHAAEQKETNKDNREVTAGLLGRAWVGAPHDVAFLQFIGIAPVPVRVIVLIVH
jgi:hypothetical protein